MRFTLIKDLKQDKLMKPILGGLLAFTLLYIVSDIFVKHFGFGISPETLKLTLLGDEEEFMDPISKASFLEFWHMEIFFMMMILLTLSAVFIRVVQLHKTNLIVLNLLMLSAILSLVSIAIAFFISSFFIEVYVVAFFTWHIAALYMIFASLWGLYYD